MNFILYENDMQYVTFYKDVINKLMGYSNLNYKTTIINKWEQNTEELINSIEGNKIYILDVEVEGKNGIDVARLIRDNGDWISPIIIVTSHGEFKIVGYTSKILMLDFLLKKDKLGEKLLDALKVALKINGVKKMYSFLQKGEAYQIPYDDILYIEKNLNDNCSYIVTKTDKFLIRKTIVSIEKELKGTSFCKSHRSCLVNLDNVKNVDFDNGIILFDKKTTNLLSRANKTKLKKKLGIING